MVLYESLVPATTQKLNMRDHLSWTVETKILCTRYGHGKSKDETRGRSRHQNNGKRVDRIWMK